MLTGLLETDSQLDIAIQHAVKKYMKIRFENTDPVEYANKIQGKQLNKFLEKFDYSIPVIVKNAVTDQFGFTGYNDIVEFGDDSAKRSVIIGTINYYKK